MWEMRRSHPISLKILYDSIICLNQIEKVRMQIEELKKEFDKLQLKYGAKGLMSVYGAGCIKNPSICFVFMNPTAKNISSIPTWDGLRAPWISTKNVWKIFFNVGLLSEEIYKDISSKKPLEWDKSLAEAVYRDIEKNKVYITNLGKCTQADARPLANRVFKEYLDLLKREIEIINPEIIITFGNQVSSIFLEREISVSKCRGLAFEKVISNKSYQVYPIYYPVGQGMRNMNIVIEDIKKLIG